MKPLCDIIIPTYNNPGQLIQCVNSIRLSIFGPAANLIRIIIVNNGSSDLPGFRETDTLKILSPGKNLGWEGGLIEGLRISESPIVVFCNDDIRIPPGQKNWLWRMVSLFNDPKVGAVGPSSNFVMGKQSIFLDIVETIIEVKFLIGFFFMIRREALDKSGGVDPSLPGGDDLDLSIRIRDAGYRLLADRGVFVYHHGQQTGHRVHPGSWSSEKHIQETNNALIKKHGMRKFYETMVVGWNHNTVYSRVQFADSDVEGDICRTHIEGEKVLELGAGATKTCEKSVCLDLYGPGETIPLVGEPSLADAVCDVSLRLPFDKESQDTIIARHILEHCQDTLGTLKSWNEALKMGGKLIIAVPNQQLQNTIMVNPEHVATFVPSSLITQVKVCGFVATDLYTDVNGTSFVLICKKTREPLFDIDFAEKTVSPLAARLEEKACA